MWLRRGLAAVLLCQMGLALAAGSVDTDAFARVLAETDQEMVGLEFEEGAEVERGLDRLAVWTASAECEREFVKAYMGVYVEKEGYAESLKSLRVQGESDRVLQSWEDHWIVARVVSRGTNTRVSAGGEAARVSVSERLVWRSVRGGVPPVLLKPQEGMGGRWASAKAVVVEVQEGLAKGSLRWITPAELLCGFTREGVGE